MQIKSLYEVFESEPLTKEHPISPEGQLFTYYPLEDPENLHYHDFLELGYCESGTGLFYLDGHVIPFTGPCCSIIYPGQIHIAQSVNAEKSLWHFLYVDIEKLFSGGDIMTEDMKALHAQQYDFPSLIDYSRDPVIYHLCEAIMSEAAESRQDHLKTIRCLVQALFLRHSRYMKPAAQNKSGRTELLERLGPALTYLNEHFAEDISIDRLASIACMSRSTLQRDMLAFTGMAPGQYVHYLRMKHAAAMLSNKRKSIASVASEVGYDALSSFNRHFFARFGMSPSEWRKKQETDRT